MPDNLPELRDIHLPEGVSLYPLGYGWWVILCSILVCVASFYLIRFAVKKSKKYYALKLLNKIDIRHPVQAAISISEILRRICIYKYPQAITLSDKEWIDFLNSKSKIKLETNAAALLRDAPYMPANKVSDGNHIKELKIFCQKWIGENL